MRLNSLLDKVQWAQQCIFNNQSSKTPTQLRVIKASKQMCNAKQVLLTTAYATFQPQVTDWRKFSTEYPKHCKTFGTSTVTTWQISLLPTVVWINSAHSDNLADQFITNSCVNKLCTLTYMYMLTSTKWCNITFYDNFCNADQILTILSLIHSGLNCRRWEGLLQLFS